MQKYLAECNFRQLRCLCQLSMLFITVCIQLLNFGNALNTGDLSSSKYHSYLQYPRIHFAGKFKANVATGNNIATNYNNDDFFSYDRFGTFYGGKNQWNPSGTNDFTLVDCHVTSACSSHTSCTESSKEDKICGSAITDSVVATFAKMVDIDVGFQTVPEIWGLKVRLPGFLEGEMEAAPLHYYWHRSKGKGDAGSCGVYQSILNNVKWGQEAHSSAAVKQMQETMKHIGSAALSIIFSLDMYHIGRGEDFAMGRIIGTIGVSGPSAPSVGVFGRSLAPMFHRHINKPRNDTIYVYSNHAPFVVDEGKLHINFLNAFHSDKHGNPVALPIGTKIGYFPNANYSENSRLGSCKQPAIVIQDFSSINLTNAVLKFGGIIDISANDNDLKALSSVPLAIFQLNGTECHLFMQEYVDGLYVGSFENWVYRLEHGQHVNHKIFVTKFGKPGKDVNVTITPMDTEFIEGDSIGKKENRPFSSISNFTDENGLAFFSFPTRSSNNFTRVSQDGNLEGFSYSLLKSEMASKPINIVDKMIVARVYHNHPYPEETTWTDHVLPIFKQYANLFPVMRSRGFDMSNYFDVVAHKEILLLSMTLPFTHPSYMPATRDLSKVKQQMIISWLKQDVPPFGDPKSLLTRHYLLELLQTALELSHANIPPLLTAIWSIKPGHNKKVQRVLTSVLRIERENMNTIAKIIQSLGGHPKLFHKHFVLNYPSRLPDGIQKDFILSLEKLSGELIRDKLMALKRPDVNKLGSWFKKIVFKHTDVNGRCYRNERRAYNKKCHKHQLYSRIHGKRYKNKCKLALDVMLRNSLHKLKPERFHDFYVASFDRQIFNYHSSIENFYNHILLVLSFITNCGANNTIFNIHTENSMNLTSNIGKRPIINEYFSAVEELRQLMRKTNSGFRESQYMMLNTIVQERSSPSILEMRFRRKKARKNTAGIVKNGVWNILPNQKLSSHANGKARNLAIAFNDIYTFYLIHWEKMFKTRNPKFRKSHAAKVKELMKAFHIIGKQLVQTPLEERGNKHLGPNGAPTFEIDFEMARKKFLLNKRMILTLKKASWDIDKFMELRKKFLDKPPPSRHSKRKLGVNGSQRKGGNECNLHFNVYHPLEKNPLIDIMREYDDLPLK